MGYTAIDETDFEEMTAKDVQGFVSEIISGDPKELLGASWHELCAAFGKEALQSKALLNMEFEYISKTFGADKAEKVKEELDAYNITQAKAIDHAKIIRESDHSKSRFESNKERKEYELDIKLYTYKENVLEDKLDPIPYKTISPEIFAKSLTDNLNTLYSREQWEAIFINISTELIRQKNLNQNAHQVYENILGKNKATEIITCAIDEYNKKIKEFNESLIKVEDFYNTIVDQRFVNEEHIEKVLETSHSESEWLSEYLNVSKQLLALQLMYEEMQISVEKRIGKEALKDLFKEVKENTKEYLRTGKYSDERNNLSDEEMKEIEEMLYP